MFADSAFHYLLPNVKWFWSLGSPLINALMYIYQATLPLKEHHKRQSQRPGGAQPPCNYTNSCTRDRLLSAVLVLCAPIIQSNTWLVDGIREVQHSEHGITAHLPKSRNQFPGVFHEYLPILYEFHVSTSNFTVRLPKAIFTDNCASLCIDSFFWNSWKVQCFLKINCEKKFSRYFSSNWFIYAK